MKIISIHALLAESDHYGWSWYDDFTEFLSTLSLRRATELLYHFCPVGDISIHALLAESDRCSASCNVCSTVFLSTLSLRRATFSDLVIASDIIHFYPRSPCGERPIIFCKLLYSSVISIHALLAESDVAFEHPAGLAGISIHALLAESDQGDLFQCLDAKISIHALLAESDLLARK